MLSPTSQRRLEGFAKAREAGTVLPSAVTKGDQKKLTGLLTFGLH